MNWEQIAITFGIVLVAAGVSAYLIHRSHNAQLKAEQEAAYERTRNINLRAKETFDNAYAGASKLSDEDLLKRLKEAVRK